MKILAIDPAPKESGYCIIDDEFNLYEFGKVDNEELRMIVMNYEFDVMAIEMIKNMGMSAIGQSIFETCVWIGRFIELTNKSYHYIYRYEEKMNLCNSMKAKDSNIRQALIDRFGVVGTKGNQGKFYGVKSDIWSAIAIGVTYIDKSKK